MDEFETECEKRREENHTFMIGFRQYLENRKTSKKTTDKHFHNIDFFINEFLLYEDPPMEASEGITEINYFLGYWFIQKAMWASRASIKENITSLKLFYAYMNQIGQVSGEELMEMKENIKENKDEWIDTVVRYDDPDVDLEDVWE